MIIYGQDKLAFLNRQSTNTLTEIRGNDIITTVLTSPSARILDVLSVFIHEDYQDVAGDAAAPLGVLTLPARSRKTFEFLKNRIFFMDRVTIENQSDQYALVELMGSQIESILYPPGFEHPLEASEIINLPILGIDVMVFGIEPALGMGYRVLVCRDYLDQLRIRLSEHGVIELDEKGYETCRVENGCPGPMGELNESYTPLEVGLGSFVSDNKGCYTGQEVIARQVNYDKVTQVLAGIRLEEGVNRGAHITREGRSVGTITSVAFSARFGWIALAVVRRSYLDFGSGVEILASDFPAGQDRVIGGFISELPFS